MMIDPLAIPGAFVIVFLNCFEGFKRQLTHRPDELDLLVNMSRLQLDENNLSGTIPKSFTKMRSMKHFHLNNNSFGGQIPPELSQIHTLVHVLLDNNNLSEDIPPEFSSLSELEILYDLSTYGYEPLIAVEAAHQLHILIFFLAVFHVLYSALTMMLGKLKIRGWKNWERETLTLDYESTNHPSSFRLTHETSFVRTHTSFWTRIPFFFYVDQLSRNVQIAIHQDTRTAVENGPILLSQARAPCRLCLGLHESRKCTSRNAALTCSAYLRLSTNLTKDDMKGIVEGTIIEMGLHECAVRIIENWHLRGISGLCCTLALYGIS